ncbi:hypothetical protein ADUPG1_006882, partial [Aduncisulcus paluster]
DTFTPYKKGFSEWDYSLEDKSGIINDIFKEEWVAKIHSPDEDKLISKSDQTLDDLGIESGDYLFIEAKQYKFVSPSQLENFTQLGYPYIHWPCTNTERRLIKEEEARDGQSYYYTAARRVNYRPRVLPVIFYYRDTSDEKTCIVTYISIRYDDDYATIQKAVFDSLTAQKKIWFGQAYASIKREKRKQMDEIKARMKAERQKLIDAGQEVPPEEEEEEEPDDSDKYLIPSYEHLGFFKIEGSKSKIYRYEGVVGDDSEESSDDDSSSDVIGYAGEEAAKVAAQIKAAKKAQKQREKAEKSAQPLPPLARRIGISSVYCQVTPTPVRETPTSSMMKVFKAVELASSNLNILVYHRNDLGSGEKTKSPLVKASIKGDTTLSGLFEFVRTNINDAYKQQREVLAALPEEERPAGSIPADIEKNDINLFIRAYSYYVSAYSTPTLRELCPTDIRIPEDIITENDNGTRFILLYFRRGTTPSEDQNSARVRVGFVNIERLEQHIDLNGKIAARVANEKRKREKKEKIDVDAIRQAEADEAKAKEDIGLFNQNTMINIEMGKTTVNEFKKQALDYLCSHAPDYARQMLARCPGFDATAEVVVPPPIEYVRFAVIDLSKATVKNYSGHHVVKKHPAYRGKRYFAIPVERVYLIPLFVPDVDLIPQGDIRNAIMYARWEIREKKEKHYYYYLNDDEEKEARTVEKLLADKIEPDLYESLVKSSLNYKHYVVFSTNFCVTDKDKRIDHGISTSGAQSIAHPFVYAQLATPKKPGAGVFAVPMIGRYSSAYNAGLYRSILKIVTEDSNLKLISKDDELKSRKKKEKEDGKESDCKKDEEDNTEDVPETKGSDEAVEEVEEEEEEIEEGEEWKWIPCVASKYGGLKYYGETSYLDFSAGNLFVLLYNKGLSEEDDEDDYSRYYYGRSYRYGGSYGYSSYGSSWKSSHREAGIKIRKKSDRDQAKAEEAKTDDESKIDDLINHISLISTSEGQVKGDEFARKRVPSESSSCRSFSSSSTPIIGGEVYKNCLLTNFKFGKYLNRLLTPKMLDVIDKTLESIHIPHEKIKEEAHSQVLEVISASTHRNTSQLLCETDIEDSSIFRTYMAASDDIVGHFQDSVQIDPYGILSKGVPSITPELRPGRIKRSMKPTEFMLSSPIRPVPSLPSNKVPMSFSFSRNTETRICPGVHTMEFHLHRHSIRRVDLSLSISLPISPLIMLLTQHMGIPIDDLSIELRIFHQNTFEGVRKEVRRSMIRKRREDKRNRRKSSGSRTFSSSSSIGSDKESTTGMTAPSSGYSEIAGGSGGSGGQTTSFYTQQLHNTLLSAPQVIYPAHIPLVHLVDETACMSAIKTMEEDVGSVGSDGERFPRRLFELRKEFAHEKNRKSKSRSRSSFRASECASPKFSMLKSVDLSFSALPLPPQSSSFVVLVSLNIHSTPIFFAPLTLVRTHTSDDALSEFSLLNHELLQHQVQLAKQHRKKKYGDKGVVSESLRVLMDSSKRMRKSPSYAGSTSSLYSSGKEHSILELSNTNPYVLALPLDPKDIEEGDLVSIEDVGPDVPSNSQTKVTDGGSSSVHVTSSHSPRCHAEDVIKETQQAAARRLCGKKNDKSISFENGVRSTVFPLLPTCLWDGLAEMIIHRYVITLPSVSIVAKMHYHPLLASSLLPVMFRPSIPLFRVHVEGRTLNTPKMLSSRASTADLSTGVQDVSQPSSSRSSSMSSTLKRDGSLRPLGNTNTRSSSLSMNPLARMKMGKHPTSKFWQEMDKKFGKQKKSSATSHSSPESGSNIPRPLCIVPDAFVDSPFSFSLSLSPKRLSAFFNLHSRMFESVKRDPITVQACVVCGKSGKIIPHVNRCKLIAPNDQASISKQFDSSAAKVDQDCTPYALFSSVCSFHTPVKNAGGMECECVWLFNDTKPGSATSHDPVSTGKTNTTTNSDKAPLQFGSANPHLEIENSISRIQSNPALVQSTRTLVLSLLPPTKSDHATNTNNTITSSSSSPVSPQQSPSLCTSDYSIDDVVIMLVCVCGDAQDCVAYRHSLSSVNREDIRRCVTFNGDLVSNNKSTSVVLKTTSSQPKGEDEDRSSNISVDSSCDRDPKILEFERAFSRDRLFSSSLLSQPSSISPSNLIDGTGEWEHDALPSMRRSSTIVSGDGAIPDLVSNNKSTSVVLKTTSSQPKGEDEDRSSNISVDSSCDRDPKILEFERAFSRDRLFSSSLLSQPSSISPSNLIDGTGEWEHDALPSMRRSSTIVSGDGAIPGRVDDSQSSVKKSIGSVDLTHSTQNGERRRFTSCDIQDQMGMLSRRMSIQRRSRAPSRRLTTTVDPSSPIITPDTIHSDTILIGSLQHNPQSNTSGEHGSPQKKRCSSCGCAIYTIESDSQSSKLCDECKSMMSSSLYDFEKQCVLGSTPMHDTLLSSGLSQDTSCESGTGNPVMSKTGVPECDVYPVFKSIQNLWNDKFLCFSLIIPRLYHDTLRNVGCYCYGSVYGSSQDSKQTLLPDEKDKEKTKEKESSRKGWWGRKKSEKRETPTPEPLLPSMIIKEEEEDGASYCDIVSLSTSNTLSPIPISAVPPILKSIPKSVAIFSSLLPVEKVSLLRNFPQDPDLAPRHVVSMMVNDPEYCVGLLRCIPKCITECLDVRYQERQGKGQDRRESVCSALWKTRKSVSARKEASDLLSSHLMVHKPSSLSHVIPVDTLDIKASTDVSEHSPDPFKDVSPYTPSMSDMPSLSALSPSVSLSVCVDILVCGWKALGESVAIRGGGSTAVCNICHHVKEGNGCPCSHAHGSHLISSPFYQPASLFSQSISSALNTLLDLLGESIGDIPEESQTISSLSPSEPMTEEDKYEAEYGKIVEYSPFIALPPSSLLLSSFSSSLSRAFSLLSLLLLPPSKPHVHTQLLQNSLVLSVCSLMGKIIREAVDTNVSQSIDSSILLALSVCGICISEWTKSVAGVCCACGELCGLVGDSSEGFDTLDGEEYLVEIGVDVQTDGKHLCSCGTGVCGVVLLFDRLTDVLAGISGQKDSPTVERKGGAEEGKMRLKNSRNIMDVVSGCLSLLICCVPELHTKTHYVKASQDSKSDAEDESIKPASSSSLSSVWCELVQTCLALICTHSTPTFASAFPSLFSSVLFLTTTVIGMCPSPCPPSTITALSSLSSALKRLPFLTASTEHGVTELLRLSRASCAVCECMRKREAERIQGGSLPDSRRSSCASESDGVDKSRKRNDSRHSSVTSHDRSSQSYHSLPLTLPTTRWFVSASTTHYPPNMTHSSRHRSGYGNFVSPSNIPTHAFTALTFCGSGVGGVVAGIANNRTLSNILYYAQVYLRTRTDQIIKQRKNQKATSTTRMSSEGIKRKVGSDSSQTARSSIINSKLSSLMGLLSVSSFPLPQSCPSSFFNPIPSDCSSAKSESPFIIRPNSPTQISISSSSSSKPSSQTASPQNGTLALPSIPISSPSFPSPYFSKSFLLLVKELTQWEETSFSSHSNTERIAEAWRRGSDKDDTLGSSWKRIERRRKKEKDGEEADWKVSTQPNPPDSAAWELLGSQISSKTRSVPSTSSNSLSSISTESLLSSSVSILSSPLLMSSLSLVSLLLSGSFSLSLPSSLLSYVSNAISVLGHHTHVHGHHTIPMFATICIV